MPRATLTREQIVSAAEDLLDGEGMEGMNMRSLGVRVESAATAVYWHVGSKANLIAFARDRMFAEIALPDVAEMHWRTAAAQMATELHALLDRHTWLVQAFGAYPVFGPGKARHDDHTLAVFESAGFTPEQADMAAATVFTFVLGNALGPAAAASLTGRLSRDGGDPHQLMHDSLDAARETAALFPRLRARFGTAAGGYAAAPVGTFEFGLRALLDGLASPSRHRQT